eukprot:SAG31_NODE_1193_length_9454_cov_38.779156_4_plen_81_part_00
MPPKAHRRAAAKAGQAEEGEKVETINPLRASCTELLRFSCYAGTAEYGPAVASYGLTIIGYIVSYGNRYRYNYATEIVFI